MSTATTATRSPRPGARLRTRCLTITMLAAAAVVCSIGFSVAPANATTSLDEAHLTVRAADTRNQHRARRLRGRGTHTVRPQARRRSRCLAHTSKPVHQRPRFVDPATGPPVHRGPPTT